MGGQWYIKESAVAYLVRGQQETTVETHRGVEEEEQLPMGIERKVVFDRIRARKDAIRERWEEERVSVDVATMVRELREEAH